MNFVDVIAAKNNVTMKRWPALPKAFNNNRVETVVEKLKEEGWDVFDAVVEGTPVHMARMTVNEIYFNNEAAIYTSSDYGHFQGKVFDLSLCGDYKANAIPEQYWCKI